MIRSPHPLIRVANAIDRAQDRLGKWIIWVALIMVLIAGFNTFARYTDRMTGLGLSSNMYIELQWYLFSVLFLLGAAYTLKHDAHVRVDLLYGRLGPVGKAWIDLGGTVLFLIPFCVLMLWVSWPSVVNSWSVMEMSPDPGGLPRYPIKTVVPLAFILVLIQGISLGCRSLATIRLGGEPTA